MFALLYDDARKHNTHMHTHIYIHSNRHRHRHRHKRKHTRVCPDIRTCGEGGRYSSVGILSVSVTSVFRARSIYTCLRCTCVCLVVFVCAFVFACIKRTGGARSLNPHPRYCSCSCTSTSTSCRVRRVDYYTRKYYFSRSTCGEFQHCCCQWWAHPRTAAEAGVLCCQCETGFARGSFSLHWHRRSRRCVSWFTGPAVAAHQSYPVRRHAH
jgi:hypothetical protein